MGCRLIAEKIEQGPGCSKHLTHAEFAFLTTNFRGQLTRCGRVARHIATVGQPNDGIGKLAAQAFFRALLIDHSIGGIYCLLGGLRQGKGPFLTLRCTN